MEKKEKKDGEKLDLDRFKKLGATSVADLMLGEEGIKARESFREHLNKGITYKQFIELAKKYNCSIRHNENTKYNHSISVDYITFRDGNFYRGQKDLFTIYSGHKLKEKMSNDFSKSLSFINNHSNEIVLKSFARKDRKGDFFCFYERPEKEKVEPSVQEPKFGIFQQIKTAVSPLGNSFAFCRYKGQGVIIEKGIIEYFNLSFGGGNYKIDINQTVLIKTGEENVLKLFLKVLPKSWGRLEQLKRMMKKGISFDKVTSFTKDSIFKLKDIKGKYGQFVTLSPSSIFDYNESHKINIYPGNSVKLGIAKLDSSIDFINKNKDRIIFKSFNKEESVYYRFYLRKTKTVIKAKAEITKAEKDI